MCVETPTAPDQGRPRQTANDYLADQGRSFHDCLIVSDRGAQIFPTCQIPRPSTTRCSVRFLFIATRRKRTSARPLVDHTRSTHDPSRPLHDHLPTHIPTSSRPTRLFRPFLDLYPTMYYRVCSSRDRVKSANYRVNRVNVSDLVVQEQ